jgi:hypothetical protein
VRGSTATPWTLFCVLAKTTAAKRRKNAAHGASRGSTTKCRNKPRGWRKNPNQGIDGRFYFHDEKGGKTKQIILSVKAGHVQASHVRDLRGVIEREKAEIGVLISMEHPTKPMLKEAAEAGFYKSPGLTDKYPRIQILSIEELLAAKKIDYPRFASDATFKKAPRARKAAEEQIPLGTGEIEEPF